MTIPDSSNHVAPLLSHSFYFKYNNIKWLLNVWKAAAFKNWMIIYILDDSWGLREFKCLIPHRCKTNIWGVKLSAPFYMRAVHKTVLEPLVPLTPASESRHSPK